MSRYEDDDDSNSGCGCTVPGIYWLFAVIYTFKYWGFGWGILNMFIPFAPIWDLVAKIGKIQ